MHEMNDELLFAVSEEPKHQKKAARDVYGDKEHLFKSGFDSFSKKV